MKGEIMAEEVENKEAPKSTGAKKSATGLDSNIAAMLAYMFGWVSGLILFLIEKDDKKVRFAAMQSIVFSVTLMVGYWVLGFIVGMLALATFGIGALFVFIFPILGIGALVVWIMLMVKAYQGEEWELPVIGKIARNFIK
jgi:uncharacterized membrane protein